MSHTTPNGITLPPIELMAAAANELAKDAQQAGIAPS